MVAADLRSPASERVAASINLLVTPLIAETTTKTLLSCAAARIISTTLPMQDAPATDVPPNFIIRSGFAPFPWSNTTWRCSKRSEECALEPAARVWAAAEEALMSSACLSIAEPTLLDSLLVPAPPLVGAAVGMRRRNAEKACSQFC